MDAPAFAVCDDRNAVAATTLRARVANADMDPDIVRMTSAPKMRRLLSARRHPRYAICSYQLPLAGTGAGNFVTGRYGAWPFLQLRVGDRAPPLA
jgi:hypothetical protein